MLKKNQRELMLDHNPVSTVELRGTHAWVQFELAGGESPLEVDRIDVRGPRAAGRRVGRAPSPLPTTPRSGRNSAAIPASAPSRSPLPARARFYRVEFDAPSAPPGAWLRSRSSARTAAWKRAARTISPAPGCPPATARSGSTWTWAPRAPSTAWRSQLDSPAARKARSKLPTTPPPGRPSKPCPPPTISNSRSPRKARYVRVLLTRPATPEGYILSELEVYGRGGPVARPEARIRPERRRVAHRARFAGNGQRRNALQARISGPGLAGGHGPRHGPLELLERRGAARPQLRRQPARHFGLVLLRRFLVPQRVSRAARSLPGGTPG